MDANTHKKLCDIFDHISGNRGYIDGSQFSRLGKQVGKVLASNSKNRKLSATVYDLVFAEVKPRGQRRVDFNGFMICLDHLSQRHGVQIEEIIEAVCAVFPDGSLDRSTTIPRRSLVGPERFFYDRNTYTGTHAYREVMHGKDEETPSGRVIDLSEIVNREKPLASVSTVPRTPVPIHRVPGQTPQSVNVTSPGLGISSTPSKGPERFYYDKTTYTGTHRFATPIKASPGILEESPVGPTSRASPAVARRRFHDDQDFSQPTTAPVSGQPTPAPQLLAPSMYSSYKAGQLYAIPVEDYFTSFLRQSTIEDDQATS